MRRVSLIAILALSACKQDISVNDNPNTPPGATISAPSDGAAVNAGQNIELVGVVADQQGLDDISVVSWTSSVDGELGGVEVATPDGQGVTRIATVLSPGVHAITLKAIDAAGEVGEDTISVSVGELDQEPVVAISSPEVFQTFFIGASVDLIGAASDPQDPADQLAVEWTAEIQGSGSPTQIWTGNPNASGIVTASWIAEQGNWILTLRASDTDGNIGQEQVAISVQNADGADLDGDGFSPLNGDCNDANPAINPNADEICGDAIDNDCNNAIDDKDEDNDGHVDEACVNYTGPDPVDDCNDDDSFIYPGAGELQDGDDNDCDGFIDEDTPAFDDDGDCFCEVGPCFGSTNATCTTIEEGDCNDSAPTTNPGAVDDPDTAFTDSNCDGIDGNESALVFLDPVGGSDSADGLVPSRAKATLQAAYTVAAAESRNGIAIAAGTLISPLSLQQGRNLYGGYQASSGWSRASTANTTLSTSSAGVSLSGATIPTKLQLVRIQAANATGPGATSVGLRIENSQGVTLEQVVVQAGNGTTGAAGTDGSAAASTAGANGQLGENGNGGNIGDRPGNGNGGAGCNGNNGGRGGSGGFGRHTDSDGSPAEAGANGIGPGGQGGAAVGQSQTGNPGSPGAPGTPGTDGAGGAPFGTFSGTYQPAPGIAGTAGTAGGGGGGGAGGGGDWIDFVFGEDFHWGGRGGGGGGGGCGAPGALNGSGGGGSFGVTITDSSVQIIGGNFISGNGGSGGAAGIAQLGAPGGLGLGGGAGGDLLGFGDSGSGGPGAAGGQGGRGGHGGGGGGGPSVAVLCRGTTNLNATGASYSAGSPGPGGASPGNAGQPGLQANTDGC